MPNAKLIKLLQQAYAIEIGAFEAYEGHWRSLYHPQERGLIQTIQLEEKEHQEHLLEMLDHLGAEPSRFYNAILYYIGKTISFGCRFMGYRLAMWGAGVMEKMGGFCYKRLSRVAKEHGFEEMAETLREMQLAEERHEKFFEDVLA